jgi:FMN phosphatase YigB (HAD superfamily)
MNRSIWCFDIDGVLINSKELVRESYKAIGINMPLEAWGHPWRTWLPAVVGSLELAEKLHREKTDQYIDVLLSGKVSSHALPCAEIARALERDPAVDVYYVTGAANSAAIVILQELGLNSKKLIASSATTADREQLLKDTALSGVYVDDRIEGQAPAHAAGWNFIWAKQDWSWKQ